MLLLVSSWVLFLLSAIIFLIVLSFFSLMNFSLNYYPSDSFSSWTIMGLKW